MADKIIALDENGDLKELSSVPSHEHSGTDITSAVEEANKLNGKSATDFVEKNFKTATITTTWSGTEAPYTQDITISGITSDNKPVIAPVYSDTLETAIAQQEAWNLIDKIVTDEDKITCYCFTEKPEVEIPIQLWVV